MAGACCSLFYFKKKNLLLSLLFQKKKLAALSFWALAALSFKKILIKSLKIKSF
jgi:hypothetical protein